VGKTERYVNNTLHSKHNLKENCHGFVVKIGDVKNQLCCDVQARLSSTGDTMRRSKSPPVCEIEITKTCVFLF